MNVNFLLGNLSIFLIILNFYLIQVFCEDSNFVKKLEYLPNGVRLTFLDLNHIYSYIELRANYMCTRGTGELAEPLQYNEQTREWVYENDDIGNCEFSDFVYELNSRQNSINHQLESKNFNYSGNGHKQKRGLGLLPDLTTGVIQGAHVETLGLSLDLPSSSHNQVQTNKPITKPKIQCNYSETTINNDQKVCKGELIFEDDFNQIDSAKWRNDVRIPLDTEDADFVSFQNSNQNLYVKAGHLYILPTLLTDLFKFNDNSIREGTLDLGNICTANIDRNSECVRNANLHNILPPIVSARITTKNTFSFKYGVIEIKAKLPKGDWLFPQLHLEPKTNHYGIANYSSGQIRMAFIRSNEHLMSKQQTQIGGSRLYGGVVLTQFEELRENWMRNILGNRIHYGDDFHVYKTTWTKDYISFKVDDNEYGTLNGNFGYEAYDLNNIQHGNFWKIGNKMAPFDKEFFLSFGVSAGGISDFPDDSLTGENFDKKPWKNLSPRNELSFWNSKNVWHQTWSDEDAALKIDYVRVWAL